MARTKASVGAKVTFGKSSKAQKVNAQPSSSSGKSKGISSKNNYSGGNPYCPRETPDWQLPITRFFPDIPTSSDDIKASGTSHHTRKNKKNVINSDTESGDDDTTQFSRNVPEISTANEQDEADYDLDTTCTNENDLLPLDDDPSSHKIGDYFQTMAHTCKSNIIKVKFSMKNKGKGKSSENRERTDTTMTCNEFNEKENMCTADSHENVKKSSPKKRMLEIYDDTDSEVNIKKQKFTTLEI